MTNKWWKKTVFYQIYPRSFCDSNGDGVGDILGIISKLDYLKDLGIGAIWLSPVYRSPNHDNGYDISDYRDINPEYGTLDDMRRLFAEASERGIRIIMDLVINHTSDEHPWFVESQKPNSPYRDYYIWKDAKSRRGKKSPPNNWWSYFGGSAWQWHEPSGQYYLHLFNSHQPDLNYRNPKVIEEIKKIMRYWLDMGAAGFRWDTVNVIYKTSFEKGRLSLSHLPGSEHYLSQPGAHTILAELKRDVLDAYDTFTVGEMTDKVSFDIAKQFTTGELDTIFTFDHLNTGTLGLPFLLRRHSLPKIKDILARWQSALTWNALFFENHDTKRSLNKFGISGRYQAKGATMLATILLTLRGVPFIYQGQEIGMENYPFRTIEEVQDVSSQSIYALLRQHKMPHWLSFRLAMIVCRDHARTPMQWDESEKAGFTTGTPWRPVHPNHEYANVATETKNPESIHTYYRQILGLRNTIPAFQYGEVKMIRARHNLFSYRRILEGDSYIVIVNMSAKAKNHVMFPGGAIVLSNYLDSSEQNRLRPFEALIIHETAS